MLRTKLAALALLALIIPACGGDRTVDPPLFQDTFSGTFPGTNWSTPATTGAGTAPTVQIVGGVLEFVGTSDTSTATTTTTTTFGNRSVSFSVQMSAKWAAGQKGTGTIEIIDGTPTVIASMSWNPETAMITYSILGTAAAPIAAPVSNGTLNHFVFSIDSAGKGTWFLNNGATVTNATAITATPLRVRLGATFGTGTWPTFDFDNVTVTSP
ncbi:MAG: hypothetical protein JO332_11160 [Planctomycetaceae bacterium]|nr:hypothetical protein [Planctomycetaceae bacterium]